MTGESHHGACAPHLLPLAGTLTCQAASGTPSGGSLVYFPLGKKFQSSCSPGGENSTEADGLQIKSSEGSANH